MAFVQENISSIRQDLTQSSRELAESLAQSSETANQEYARAQKEVQEAYDADCELLMAREQAAQAEISGTKEERKIARERVREARKASKREHKEATKFAKNAYLAVKFSEPNSLGFLRFVEVIFILNIAFTLIMLIFTSRDIIDYTPTVIQNWINVVLQGVALWFFIKRFKATRNLMIFIGIFNILFATIVAIAGSVASTASGNVSASHAIANLFIDSGFEVLLAIYFIFSRRVKQTFTMPMDFTKPLVDKAEFKINRRGWPFVRNLIIYFCVFSILGHWMEMGMCQFIIMGLVEGEYDPTNTLLWRDVLYPFPMEGIAVVIIALFLYPLKEWLCRVIKVPVLPYVISFLANALACTLIEFIMGLFVNADLQLWDYSSNFGNFMGMVCLQNSLAFGAAASFIAWLVYPLMERFLARIPQDVMNVIFVVIAVFYAILQFLYLIEPPKTGDLAAITDIAASSQGGVTTTGGSS